MLKQCIPEKKVHIIYDGVELDKGNHTRKVNFINEYKLNSSSLVGLIGRIVEGKGHKEFLMASKEVKKRMPDVKFLIIGGAKGGNGGYYKEVKEFAKREDLTKNIIFTGWRNDLKSIIADVDLIVQPYTSPEGLPNILLEAMAFNKPVISTNISGPTDIVISGKTGFLVPPGDVQRLAEKIIYLLDNPNIAKTMGENGRRRVESLFDIKKNIKQIEEIYSGLLFKEIKQG